jgi:hypothetical protein
VVNPAVADIWASVIGKSLKAVEVEPVLGDTNAPGWVSMNTKTITIGRKKSLNSGEDTAE